MSIRGYLYEKHLCVRPASKLGEADLADLITISSSATTIGPRFRAPRPRFKDHQTSHCAVGLPLSGSWSRGARRM